MDATSEKKPFVRARSASMSKPFDVFISHHSVPEATTVAIQVCDALVLKGLTVFLDVDQQLLDLRSLMRKASSASVLVVILTKSVFERPWCCAEVYAACTAKIPIVPVLVEGAGYDHKASRTFLTYLDTYMSPSALEVLKDSDVHPDEVAYELSFLVSNIIAKPFNSHYSREIRKAMLAEIVEAVLSKPLLEPHVLTKEQWQRKFPRKKPIYIVYRWSQGKHLCDDMYAALPSRVIIDKIALLDLSNIRREMEKLDEGVKCRSVIAILSSEFFQRAWCIAELYTAVTLGIPVVYVTSESREKWNTEVVHKALNRLDLDLPLDVQDKLRNAGITDIQNAAYELSTTYSNGDIIFVDLHASARVKSAMVMDGLDAIDRARIVKNETTKEAWLAKRQGQ
jgi:hypothetical protein